MLELNELTYAAVIAITLPGSDEATEITVTLTPAASIPTGKGRLKPLQECTLQELQQFADALEEELWQQHQSLPLRELAIDGQAHITITLLDDEQPEKPADDTWLQHQIVFPAEEIEQPEESAGSDEERSETEIPVSEEANLPASAGSTGEPAAAGDETAVAEALAEEVPDNTLEETGDQDELDDQVSVSESELVHAERETAPEEPAPEEPAPEFEAARPRQRLRIAGRRRPLGHPTWTAVDILINESAFRDAQAHALTSLRREVAGFLIGPPPEKQPDGRYVVHISDTIIAKHTRMHGASVTYTPESWRYVNDKLAEMYPDETAVIVGWYHTHPNFGIFLSGMDQFIHQNFFTQIWHVALVLDPVNRQSGFFCWDRPRSRVDRYEFPWPDWAAGSW